MWHGGVGGVGGRLREVCSVVARGLLWGCSRFAQGLLEGCAKVAQGLLKGCSRVAQGLLKGCSSFAQGLQHVITWLGCWQVNLHVDMRWQH